MQDAVGGRVDIFFDATMTTAAHQQGQLRPLAASPHVRRVSGCADVGRASACPGIELDFWFGLFAPAGTPQPIIARLNQKFVKAMQRRSSKFLPSWG